MELSLLCDIDIVLIIKEKAESQAFSYVSSVNANICELLSQQILNPKYTNKDVFLRGDSNSTIKYSGAA